MGIETSNTEAPGAGATPAADSTAEQGSVNWADLADSPVEFSSDDGAFVVESDTNDEPAATSEVQQPIAPPGVQNPTTEAPPVPAPVPVDSQQTPPVQPVAPTPEPQAPAIDVTADAEGFRAKYHETLQGEYALSPEDATALVMNPETVMPKLAANMHMRVMQDVVRHVELAMRAIPQMMEQRLQQTQAEESAKQTFYEEWPGLKEQHALVVKHANMARATNPQATKEQIVNMAGVLTAMALGVDPATVRKQSSGAFQAAQAPAAPQQPVAPFKPAVAGSGPAPYTTPELGLFESFAEEDINYMRG